jgi:hypothetical protein
MHYKNPGIRNKLGKYIEFGRFQKGLKMCLTLLGRLVGVRDRKIEWHHSEILSGCCKIEKPFLN